MGLDAELLGSPRQNERCPRTNCGPHSGSSAKSFPVYNSPRPNVICRRRGYLCLRQRNEWSFLLLPTYRNTPLGNHRRLRSTSEFRLGSNGALIVNGALFNPAARSKRILTMRQWNKLNFALPHSYPEFRCRHGMTGRQRIPRQQR